MKQKIPISNIQCHACEMLIEKEISSLQKNPGVEFSDDKKSIFVEIENEEEKNKISQKISELGYAPEDGNNEKNTFFDYLIIALLLIIGGGIMYLGKDFQILNDITNSQKPHFWIVVMIGFFASISSCLAITGSVVIGLGQLSNEKKLSSMIKIQGFFHLGRMSGFILGGAILGALGGYIGSLLQLNTILLGITGLIMLYLGLSMLKIFPNISRFISLPKKISQKFLFIKTPTLSPIIGAGTFFLPCGFTQSMQIIAASSGDALSGAVIMGAFALGTLPVLFVVGFGSSYFKNTKFSFLKQVMGVIVLLFAFQILTGFAQLLPTQIQKTPTQNGELKNFIEKRVSHDGLGIVGGEIILDKNLSYQLIITPIKNGAGCMTTLTIPGINNQVFRVIQGVPIVINISNISPGNYPIVCTSMGMKQGEIIIE